MIIELLLAIGCMFLDGSDYGVKKPFSVEDYLNERDAYNAGCFYREEMRRLGWRE